MKAPSRNFLDLPEFHFRYSVVLCVLYTHSRRLVKTPRGDYTNFRLFCL
jgi:hypothetical protein